MNDPIPIETGETVPTLQFSPFGNNVRMMNLIQAVFSHQRLYPILPGVAVLVGLSGCSSLRVKEQPAVQFESIYASEVHQATPIVGDPEADLRFAGPQPVEPLVSYAMANHPEVIAAQLELNAAIAEIDAAGTYDDPRLAAVVGVQPVETAAGSQDFSLSISQTVPRRKKLNAEVAAAEAKRDQAIHHLEAAQQEVGYRVRQAYANLYETTARYDLLQKELEQREQLLSLVSIADKEDPQQARVLEASQVAIQVLQLDRIELERNINMQQQQLAKSAGLSPQVRVNALEVLPQVFIEEDVEIYLELGRQFNPELSATTIQMRRSQIDAELTSISAFPDPTLTASWIEVSEDGLSPVANGQDAVLLGLSVDLPLFQAEDVAKLNRDRSQAAAIVQDHRSAKLDVHSSIRAHHASARNVMRQLALMEQQLLLSAEHLSHTSLTAFQSGEISYESMHNNSLSYFALRQRQIHLQAEGYRSFVNLIRLCGGQVPVGPAEQEPATNTTAFPLQDRSSPSPTPLQSSLRNVPLSSSRVSHRDLETAVRIR